MSRLLRRYLLNNVFRGPSFGDVEWTTPGTYNWVVPFGVTSICAVAVGGGGGGRQASNLATSYGSGGGGGALRARNGIPVTPGQTLTIVVGAGGTVGVSANGGTGGASSVSGSGFTTMTANGGQGGLNTGANASGGTSTGSPGTSGFSGNGGTGGAGSTTLAQPGGGGGAGGYSSVGGGGGSGASPSGANGGSGGGSGGGGGAGPNSSAGAAGDGGGVSLYGRGPGGIGGGVGVSGTAGSYGFGKKFGGGGRGGSTTYPAQPGGGGAVRIMWGEGRSFPDAAMRGFLPETEAFVASWSAAPSMERIALVNTLISALVDAGVWAKLGVFYLHAVDDEQAATVNVKDSRLYRASAVAAPTFTPDRGFTGNGSSAHLDAGVALSSIPEFALNDASMFIWSLSDGASNRFDMGTASDGNSAIACRDAGGNQVSLPNNLTNFNASVTDALGLCAWSRTSSSAAKSYRNGVALATTTAASTSIGAGNLTILRSNTSYSARQVAASGAGAALSDAENVTLHDALEAYLQAVGAI